MKAAFIRDQGINIANAPAFYRDQAVPVMRGDEVVDWKIPAGAIVEGDEALLRVATGQAEPIDEECAVACGMSVAQLEVKQRGALMEDLGIKGEKDRGLFMAGVIDGYAEGTTDAKSVYIRGKNWKKFEEAKAELEKEKGTI